MRPLSLSRFALVTTCMCCAVLAGVPAHAAERRPLFVIPPGIPLDRALTAFSAQSDRDILFAPGVASGLRTRGVSGRLDSTQALIVAAHTFDALGLPRENILA